MIKYFVSYSFTARYKKDPQVYSGFGNCVCDCTGKLKTTEEIEDLHLRVQDDCMKTQGFVNASVTVLFFKEL